VETEKGEEIPADLVAVAIGVLPQKELAETAGLRCRRGVVVDENLRTTGEDIFAAGDVAEVCEALTDRYTVEVLWSSAAAKGRVAGLNMSGGITHMYEKGVPLNVTRLAGFKITIMGMVGSGRDADLEGIARGDSETWRRLGEAVSVESQDGDSHIRLAVGESSISGAVVIGNQTPSFTLQRLIAVRADISGFRAKLLQAGDSLGDVIQDVWTRWSSSHV
jgi:NAD(P)H-nitrite reductase large subunit